MFNVFKLFPNSKQLTSHSSIFTILHIKVVCFSALPSQNTDIVIILIPSVAIPFVLGCIVVGLCFCRKRKQKQLKNSNPSAKFSKGKPIDLANLNFEKVRYTRICYFGMKNKWVFDQIFVENSHSTELVKY